MSENSSIKVPVPGELRKKRDEWLLELKLELIRIIRDFGKCLSFNAGQKIMWMKVPKINDYCIVYHTGVLYKVNLISLPGKECLPDFRMGLDPSIFNTEKGIPIHILLELTEMYPSNPFIL